MSLGSMDGMNGYIEHGNSNSGLETFASIKAMGGQGKSVLLLRVAHHPNILESFPLVESTANN